MNYAGHCKAVGGSRFYLQNTPTETLLRRRATSVSQMLSRHPERVGLNRRARTVALLIADEIVKMRKNKDIVSKLRAARQHRTMAEDNVTHFYASLGRNNERTRNGRSRDAPWSVVGRWPLIARSSDSDFQTRPLCCNPRDKSIATSDICPKTSRNAAKP